MTPTPDLVLFTDGFPYFGRESALSSELAVIAPHFRRVFILPPHTEARAVQLPPNAEVVDLGLGRGWSRANKLRALRSRVAVRVLAPTARRPSNWRSYARGARTYLDILSTNLLRAEELARWIAEQGLQDAIFYDYWFENSTLAVAALREAGVVRCAVSRAHRFDIFDSSWEQLGRVPFREFKAEHLDAVFAVSDDGAQYLRDRFGPYAGKVSVSRLGLPLPSPPAEPNGSEIPLVISCSALLARKQVHIIPEVLIAYGRRVRWLHFGDGPERSRVQRAAAGLPKSVAWELRGWTDNAAVRDFYSRHRVAAFLSLSISEGVPISMMEAQSFGVPIVALSAGGVPEIVRPETGLLLPPNAPASDVALALEAALTPHRFAPEQIRRNFADRYEARRNYEAFVGDLMKIWLRNRA